MKSAHTTNYCDTFIEVADDSPVGRAEVPVKKNGKETIASAQYEMISKNPYRFTSDGVLFAVFTKRNNIAKKHQKTAREKFFSKGQACLRSSSLTKRYGFGVHSKADGKVALYAIESAQYKKFLRDESALRSFSARLRQNKVRQVDCKGGSHIDIRKLIPTRIYTTPATE